MRFIGDVHGKFDDYLDVIAPVAESIQVGDFGAGFKPLLEVDMNHRFIRGNHDSPEVCKVSPNWIPDGSFDGKIFYVGGARSIDAHMRRIGIDWWDDEELSYEKWNTVFDYYEQVQPAIVVSHDAPNDIVLNLFPHINKERSKTSMGLQTLLNIFEPKLWIFGHYHVTIDWSIRNTRFICLNELDFIDIDLEGI
jgi:Icc-related predicted phosphoesterase